MIAVAWAAIGLLGATLLGVLFFVGSRLDGLSGRIDAQAARIDEQAARIDALATIVSEGFARLDERLTAHLQRHAG
ncbi:MAG: hypothetical protein ACRDI0_06750 [Actinomycetota bacterium]